MVMRIGVPLLFKLTPIIPWLPVGSVIVFLVFYLLIFSKIVKKHTARVKANPSGKMPVWQFFDLPSYIIMAVMMTGGILLRTLNLIPAWSIAFFYSGLGFALFSCGVRFISVYLRRGMESPASPTIADL